MTQMQEKAVRPFTGRHMALVMAGFFAVVVGVNLLLANLANATFSGTLVANSYVASQEFNRLLGAAEADKALGWSMTLERSGPAAVRFALRDASGQPLTGAAVQGRADHPLGAAASLPLAPREVAPGVYEAPLPAGRWKVAIAVRARGQAWHAEEDAQ